MRQKSGEPADMPTHMPCDISEDMPDDIYKDMSFDISEDMSNDISEDIPGDISAYELYDDPDMVHEALDFMTEVYLDFTRRWQAAFPPYGKGYSVEWGLLHRGLTMLRNDAIVNLSGDMYREFAMPYDARVFAELGGCMHFCGRGDHYIGAACEIEGLSGINLSQPELNDMEKIYAATIDRGRIIIGMPESEIARAGAAGRPLRGRVQSGAALSAYRER